MTRTLTSAMQTARAATSGAPVTVLEIAFGGAVGTRWFADRTLGTGDGLSAMNAQGRVTAWGRIHQVVAGQAAPAVGDCTLELADADGVLRGWFAALEFQRTPVTLYQHFEGLAESDLAPVLVGVIAAPVRWEERSASLRFDVTDVATLHRATVGHRADRVTFPAVADADESAMLPLVFGRVRRAPAVQVAAGATARLARRCGNDDTQLCVDDASGFPQDQSLRIRIEREVILGKFLGNTFHVTTRGEALVSNCAVTQSAGDQAVVDAKMPGGENQYVGYYVRITDPGGTVQHKYILSYAADLRRLTLSLPILYNNTRWTPPVGTAFDIASWARSHEAGAEVYEVRTDYVYLLNDAPSQAVHGLVGYGELVDTRVLEDHAEEILNIEGWAPINPNHYTINRNDTTSFPGLGRAVTTATFRMNPKELYPGLRSNALWADIAGVESAADGTGTLVENPVDVLETLLTRWVGLSAADYDGASFTQAASDLTGFAMAFALTEPRDALHLAADLAFQSRCALLWEDGVARLKVLKNRLETPAVTLDADVIVADSLQRGRADLRQLASEVTARYGQGDTGGAVVVRDATVEALYGRRAKVIDLWAFADRRMATDLARFRLERWKLLHEEVRLRTFLTALELQRLDTVTLDLSEHFEANQRAEVTEVIHQPGMAEGGVMDALTLGLRLPIAAGCQSTCETTCETSGESGCLLSCEAQAEGTCWQCETQCEALCELACTTEAELHCIVNDTWGGGGGGCGACETACEAACELACETGCEVTCETGCEVVCETGCEMACETGCETACETGCEVACETGCEVSCETGCELTCETGCEAACQTGCEATCEMGCETTCETGCEQSCETGCETSAEATWPSDDFNRSDGSLGANWTQFNRSGAPNSMTISGNAVELDPTGQSGSYPGKCAFHNSQMPSADQVVKVNWTHQGASSSYKYFDVYGRSASASNRNSCYFGEARNAQDNLFLVKRVSGAQTILAQGGSYSNGTGQYTLTINGTAIEFKNPNGQTKTATDSDLTTGSYAGFALCAGPTWTAGTMEADNFTTEATT